MDESTEIISVNIGSENNQDRTGDLYNAISEVVDFFLGKNLIVSEDIAAEVLKLKASYLEEV